MATLIYCTVSIVIFAVAIAVYLIMARKNSHSKIFFGTLPVEGILLFGVFLAVAVLIAPLYHEYGIVQGSILTAVNSLRIMSLEDDFTLVKEVLERTSFASDELGHLYSLYASLLYIAYPVITGLFLVSVFENISEKIRYRFARNETLAFCALNENALTLAESMRSADSKARIVFTDVSDKVRQENPDLVERAKRIRAICIDDDMACMKFARNCEYTVFLIDRDENRDLTVLSELAHRLTASTQARLKLESGSCSRKERARIKAGFFDDGSGEIKIIKHFSANVNIKLFSCTAEAERLTDLIMERFYCAADGQSTDGSIRAECINDVALMTHALLEERPLFLGESCCEDGKKLISVLIMGCGTFGVEFFKNAVWCSRMINRTVRFTIADKHATDTVRPKLLYDCPELFSHEDEYGEIRFVDADFDTDGIDRAVSACPDATYAVVSCGDDSLNIRVAMELRVLFSRQHLKHKDFVPVINVRVRDAYRSVIINDMKTPDDKTVRLELYPFGDMHSVYNKERMASQNRDALLETVHVVIMAGASSESDKLRERLNYRCDEYCRSSTCSWYLHMKYRMKSFGLELDDWCASLTSENVQALADAVKDSDGKDAELEHARWNAFMRTRGFVSASKDAVDVYKTLPDGRLSHKFMTARMHPCITDWDTLDGVSALCVSLGIKKPGCDFKEHDRLYNKLLVLAAQMRELNDAKAADDTKKRNAMRSHGGITTAKTHGA